MSASRTTALPAESSLRAAGRLAFERGAALPPVVMIVDVDGFDLRARLAAHPGLPGADTQPRGVPASWDLPIKARRWEHPAGTASIRAGRVRVTASSSWTEVDDQLRAPGGLMVSASTLPALLSRCRARSLPVAAGGDGTAVMEYLARAERQMRLGWDPAAPGQLAIHLPGVRMRRAAVAEALAAAGAQAKDREVTADALAGELIDIAAGRSVCDPPGRTLHEAQRRLASAYAAAHSLGVVGALPPGAGKTLAGAAALAAHQKAHPHAEGTAWRAVVCAPGAVHDHWCAELRAAGLACSRCPDGGPVQLLTPAGLASQPPIPVSDMVIDEAEWVRSRTSAQGRAARAWRLQAQRCLLLTATPNARGARDILTLAQLAAGRPDTAAARGISPAAASAGLVVTGTGPQSPAVAWTPVAVRLCSAGRSAQEAADAAWRDRLPSHAPQRLAAANAALRAAARHAADCTEADCMRAQLVDRLALHATAGRQALLCTTVPALAAAVDGDLAGRGIRVGTARRGEDIQLMHAGQIDVLLLDGGTSAGLNLQGPDLVVQADLPARAGDAVQRLGRAARPGSTVPVVVTELWAAGAAAGWARAMRKGAIHVLDHTP